jgi:hypothetical protein
MKNKIIIITTLILAINGVAYANRTISIDNTGSSNASTVDDQAVGSTSYYRMAGGSYLIITGVVTSINTSKNAFVVEDQNSKTSRTVLTNAQTVATLSKGKIVTVKLQQGNPFALSVGVSS